MNKVIEKIASEAYLKAKETSPNWASVFVDLFSRMIIKDCCYKLWEDCYENNRDYKDCEQKIQKIKDHFGIE